MAKFEMELPDEIMKDLKEIYDYCEDVFGHMTRAGAKQVKETVEKNLPGNLKDSSFTGCIKLTRTYKTPSDGGINTKVIISDYFINSNGVKTPAPLVANMFEYGSNSRNFPKQPFFRKSFKKAQIEKAMLEAQKKLSGGLLDE